MPGLGIYPAQSGKLTEAQFNAATAGATNSIAGVKAALATANLIRLAPSLPTAANNRIAMIGDSRTAQFTSLQGEPDTRAFPTHLRQRGQGRVDLRPENIFAQGGFTIAEMISAGFHTSAAASNCGTVVILAGTNSTRSGSETLQNMISGLDTMIATCRNAGKIVVVCDEMPTQFVGTDQAKLTGIRDYIRTLHNPANGIRVANTWNAIADAADSQTPASGVYTDGLHPAPVGAVFVANAVLSPLFEVLPAGSIHVGRTYYGAQFGTAEGSGAPTGWSASVPNGTLTQTRTLVNGILEWRLDFANVVAPSGSNICQIPGPTNTDLIDGDPFIPGTTSIGALLYAKLHAGHINFRNVELYTQVIGGNRLLATFGGGVDDAVDAKDAGSANQLPYAPGEANLVLNPFPGVLPSGADRLRHLIWIYGLQGQSATFSITFYFRPDSGGFYNAAA